MAKTQATRTSAAGTRTTTANERRGRSCPRRWPGPSPRRATNRRSTSWSLDLRKAGGFTDYFVICSGTNPRQDPRHRRFGRGDPANRVRGTSDAGRGHREIRVDTARLLQLRRPRLQPRVPRVLQPRAPLGGAPSGMNTPTRHRRATAFANGAGMSALRRRTTRIADVLLGHHGWRPSVRRATFRWRLQRADLSAIAAGLRYGRCARPSAGPVATRCRRGESWAWRARCVRTAGDDRPTSTPGGPREEEVRRRAETDHPSVQIRGTPLSGRPARAPDAPRRRRSPRRRRLSRPRALASLAEGDARVQPGVGTWRDSSTARS